MIHQNPLAALDPRLTVVESVAEPLRFHGVSSARLRRSRALESLAEVRITEAVADKRPAALSGGEAQRAAIARALILEPEILVCDEPVSALDVSIQAGVLATLRNLYQQRGMAIVFVSHDIAAVSTLCRDTAVVFRGRIVEQAPTRRLLAQPRHPYTAALLAAAPSLGGKTPALAETAPQLDGPGCAYRSVCPRAKQICAQQTPALSDEGGHGVACFSPIGATRVRGNGIVNRS